MSVTLASSYQRIDEYKSSVVREHMVEQHGEDQKMRRI